MGKRIEGFAEYVVSQGADLTQFSYHPSVGIRGVNGLSIDGLYIKKDGSLAVGVIRPTVEQYQDHFKGRPIMRAVDQLDVMSRVGKLLVFLTNNPRISGKVRTGFDSLEDASFVNMILPPHAVNVAVGKDPGDQDHLKAVILSGENVVSQALLVKSSPDIELPESPPSKIGLDRVVISDQRVKEVLGDFGYGESMMRLDRVIERGGQRIGILRIRPGFHTYDPMEAIAQNLLVVGVEDGTIKNDLQPLFTSIPKYQAMGPIASGSELTIALEVAPSGREFSAIGRLRAGNSTGSAVIGGVVLSKNLVERRVVPARLRDQQKESLVFP